jgi:hypothetical protein
MSQGNLGARTFRRMQQSMQRGHLTCPTGASASKCASFNDLRSHQPLDDGSVLVPIPRGCAVRHQLHACLHRPHAEQRTQGLLHLLPDPGEQSVNKPVPFPWTVCLGDQDRTHNTGGRADNAAVTDVELLGAWDGASLELAWTRLPQRLVDQSQPYGILITSGEFRVHRV